MTKVTRLRDCPNDRETKLWLVTLNKFRQQERTTRTRNNAPQRRATAVRISCGESTERGSTSAARITTIMGPRDSVPRRELFIGAVGPSAHVIRQPALYICIQRTYNRVCEHPPGFSSFVTRLYTIAHKYLVELRSSCRYNS